MSCPTERIALDGLWSFRLDPEASGEANRWHQAEATSSGWIDVEVPHTWQVTPGEEDYRGVAWYRHTFEGRPEWAQKALRVEFEAVFHSASVWLNGKPVGEHLRKGYTAFAMNLTGGVRLGAANLLAVKVNNAFDDSMLPRGRSSDWAHDGGIYRPVHLLVTPLVFIERLAIDAIPDMAAHIATIETTAVVRNLGSMPWRGQVTYEILEDDSGQRVHAPGSMASITLQPGEVRTVPLAPGKVEKPRLWHFDSPNLYRIKAQLVDPDRSSHEHEETFGVRLIEIRDGAFHVNGERMRLMGVERMAGSNPEFGMAETAEWIAHDHEDMKDLNCVFTRAHWQQDRRVLDYCDRHGIFFQSEVPTWGPNTFKGMGPDPLPALMENGLEQLREMIARDRNHPSVFAWGLCNEIGGQNPPAYEFAKRMYAEAKKLDPRRLCSYASNSLQRTPEKDVSGLMDFVEFNEYYESWFQGGQESLRSALQAIHEAFPTKPIVISEYGYCACTPDRPEGDARRVEILEGHTQILRDLPFIQGAIFFCYNDYRTHIGDKGLGAMKQRIHGVVDLFGGRKPSYEKLRRESSAIELFRISGHPENFSISFRVRNTLPAYALAGYKLRAVLYGYGNIPLERSEVLLPRLAPGDEWRGAAHFQEKMPLRVQFDVLRPTGFSAHTHEWRA